MNNSQVAHTWAQNTTNKGKNSSNSYSFDGPILYSYTTPIAIFKHKADGSSVCILSNYSYSNTTCKHQSHAWRASTHHEQITVSCQISDLRDFTFFDSVIENLLEQVEEAIEKAKRSRKYTEMHLKEANKKASQALSLCNSEGYSASVFADRFYIKGIADLRLVANSIAFEGFYSEQVDARYKDKKAEIKRREEQRQKDLAETKAKQAEQAKILLGRWRNFQPTRSAVSLYCLPVALRLSKDGETVETSHGATVSIEEAKKALSLFNASKLDFGHKIGMFSVGYVGSDLVRVGCHDIPVSEIKHLEKLLNK